MTQIEASPVGERADDPFGLFPLLLFRLRQFGGVAVVDCPDVVQARQTFSEPDYRVDAVGQPGAVIRIASVRSATAAPAPVA